MIKKQYTNWPLYTETDIQRVVDVVRSNKVNYWTGEEGRLFEREFAEQMGSSHAIAMANGTVALDVILLAMGIGEGDEVIVTPRTFLASASSIINSGANAVFADVDLITQNITAETIAEKITPKTKAILCVHLAGWPCDMEPILALAQQHDAYVIEDCAQAHGARYKGKSVGSFGHAAAWSFCQDKIMTTLGEGGMVTTNDKDLWDKMWSYKDHGKSYDAVYNRQHAPGFRWLHESFGTNWRLTEVQSAVGREQLKCLPAWTAARTANSNIYREEFSSLGLLRELPAVPNDIVHAYYKYYEFIKPENLKEGWSRDRIISEVTAKGVPLYAGSCSEVYLEKAFDGHPSRPAASLPAAKELGDTSLMWLVHPTLDKKDVAECAHVSATVLRDATR